MIADLLALKEQDATKAAGEVGLAAPHDQLRTRFTERHRNSRQRRPCAAILSNLPQTYFEVAARGAGFGERGMVYGRCKQLLALLDVFHVH
jgi:hypothetical protein